MRLDDYLSTVGVIKRRTVAKDMGTNGLLEVNGRKVKPAYSVNEGDIVRIKGTRPVIVEILAIPTRSVPKAERPAYFRVVDSDLGSQ